MSHKIHKIPPATFNGNQPLKQRRQSQVHILPLLLGPRFHPHLQIPYRLRLSKRCVDDMTRKPCQHSSPVWAVSPVVVFRFVSPLNPAWMMRAADWYLSPTGFWLQPSSSQDRRWSSLGRSYFLLLYLVITFQRHTVIYFLNLAMASDERCLLNFSMENLACLVWAGLEPRISIQSQIF